MACRAEKNFVGKDNLNGAEVLRVSGGDVLLSSKTTSALYVVLSSGPSTPSHTVSRSRLGYTELEMINLCPNTDNL